MQRYSLPWPATVPDNFPPTVDEQRARARTGRPQRAGAVSARRKGGAPRKRRRKLLSPRPYLPSLLLVLLTVPRHRDHDQNATKPSREAGKAKARPSPPAVAPAFRLFSASSTTPDERDRGRMTHFGDFAPLCRQVPSYPWCNLFFRQLADHSPSALDGLSSDRESAPVGINPECGIPLVGHDGSLANIANIIVSALSMLAVGALIFFTSRRRAAVGRVEFLIFLVLYFLTLPFQLIDTGAVLQQGSTALTALTAIHAGLVAATFWALLANAIVSTQVVEDGTLSSIVPFGVFVLAFFVATGYIALDVAFTFTSVFGPSSPPADLHSIPLFVLTSIWPGAAAILYFLIMTYVVLGILNEVRPMWYFVLAAVLFVLSQLDFFLLSKVICRAAATNALSKVDGSFIATILETAAVAVLYFAWRSITEDSWEDDMYYPR